MLNSDDFYYSKESVETIAKTFDMSADADCVYGDLLVVDQSHLNRVKRVFKSCNFKRGLFQKSWTLPHPTFYCLKKVLIKLGYIGD